MKYTVFGLVDSSGKSLPAQEVEANSNAEAKILAAEQAGGFWNENTETTHWDEARATSSDTWLLTLIEKLAARVEVLEKKFERLENPSEYDLLMQSEATERALRR